VIDGPNPGSDTNVLFGIDAASASDIWAVGTFDIGDNPMSQHWNGSYWSYVPMDAVPGGSVMEDVKAVTADDVWAVGYRITSNRNGRTQDGKEPIVPRLDKNVRLLDSPDFTEETIIAHWDGQNWTRVTSPNPGTTNINSLTSIDGVASNNLWAVGSYQEAGGNHTLIVHWDGTVWNLVASPVGFLYGVTALASDDLWAVGGNASGSLTLHWDAQTWNTIASPNPGTSSNLLMAVSAVSDSDVWAVGYSQNTTGGSFPLTMHWDGAQWNAVSTPGSAQLLGVSARASNDVWAVGSGGAAQSTILHWDGTTWTEATHPAPGEDQFSELDDVLAVSANEVWAVGYIGHYYISTRIERWVGSCETPTATPAPSQTPSPTPTDCSGWGIVSSPNVGAQENVLNAIAVVSPNDVWAVGDSYDGNTHHHTLIEHWDGNEWSIVPSPDSSTGDNYLLGVAVAGPNDVWAVGYFDNIAGGGDQTLVERWNGNTWSIVPSPNPGPNINHLFGVAVSSPNDVWAVGLYLPPTGGSKTLVERWNGSVWSVVPSPDVANAINNYLNAVTVAGPGDVWAVGYYYTPSLYRTLIEHWDGSTWSIVSSSNVGTSNNYLVGVAAVTPDDIWAVGAYINVDLGSNQTLVERWNGSAWSVVPSPNLSTHDNYLFGVAAAALPNDVWAVGNFRGVTGASLTLTERWDGTQWSVAPSPNADAGENFLIGVAVGSSGDAWASGYSIGGEGSTTLTEHFTSTCATPTSTATPTSGATVSASRTTAPTSTIPVIATTTANATTTSTFTPTPNSTQSGPTSSPTATSTIPTSITSTPTLCPIQFTDVPEGSIFYSYIHCLACLGIINGYPDGTFKPTNPVTRGQLSKIVSNAVGLSDPQTAQMFQDVPVGSTFFDFIGRLASRGFISGYPCGGPGELCVPPGNLPYFRPGGTATRGQLTKIAANAEGFNQPVPAGQQTFTDVTPGSTFYLYVERLLMSRPGVMSGYPCGGPGEPCDSLHRPYFRPNNSVTRGQTAKIVANSAFPSCSP
jgi:hypothetical protein